MALRPSPRASSGENTAADIPVEKNKLAIDRRDAAVSRLDDLPCQVADEGSVPPHVDVARGLLCREIGLDALAAHAATSIRFCVSMARTKASHFFMPARFSGM